MKTLRLSAQVLVFLVIVTGLVPVPRVATTSAAGAETIYLPIISRGSRIRPQPKIIGQAGGRTSTSAIYGDRLYRDVGAEIEILDISDPLAPRPIRRFSPPVLSGQRSVVNEIRVAGDRLWVKQIGWLVYDLADPDRPRKLTRLMTPNVATEDGHRVLMDADDGLGAGIQLVDLSDPNRPVRKGTYRDYVLVNGVWDMVVDGDYAIIVEAYRGVHIVDFSSPLLPVRSAFMDLGRIYDMVFQDNRLYLHNNDELIIMDVADRDGPFELGRSSDVCSEQIVDLVGLRSNLLYVTCSGAAGSGLRIVEVDDAGGIMLLGELGGSPSTGTLGEGVVYLSSGHGLEVIDVRESDHPRRGLERPTIGSASKIASAERFVWVGDASSRSVHIFDAESPREPREVGSVSLAEPYPMTTWPYTFEDIDADGNTAVILWRTEDPDTLDSTALVSFLAIGEDGVPRETSRFRSEGTSRFAALSGDVLAIAANCDAVRFYDVSLPSEPSLLGQVDDLPCGVKAVEMIGSYVYVAGDGMVVIDIINLEAPKMAGSWGTHPLLSMVRAGRLLIVTERATSAIYLVALDLSDPFAPKEYRRIETLLSYSAADLPMALADGTLFVSEWRLRTFAANFDEIGGGLARYSHADFPGVVDLAAWGRTVWAAGGAAGVLTIRE